MGIFDWLFGKRDTGPAGRFDLAELVRRIDVDVDTLTKLQPAYNAFTIPKRRGGGVRQILAPSDGLKHVQRRILHRLLQRLAAHPAAHGFERTRSIVTNALPHVGAVVVMKLDVKDFFPATTAERVHEYFRFIGWDATSAKLLTKLTTHEGALPQGAPTSPRLSNLLNVHVDAALSTLAGRYHAVYTRYADDITFSWHDPEKAGHTEVNSLLWHAKFRLSGEGYRLHTDGRKLQIRRRQDQMRVTGLVVNEVVQLPRQTRRWLRAVEHRLKKNGKATISEQQFEGWRALQAMIAKQSTAEG